MKKTTLCMTLMMSLLIGAPAALAADTPKAPAASKPSRPPAAARDPHAAGYVEAKELPDGEVPPADADGNFIVGPTHKKAPEMSAKDGVPQGKVHELTMK